MSRTVTIPVERASHEAFAPFGQLISEQGSPPVFHGDGLRSWRLAYDIDGTTELMFIRYDYKPMIFLGDRAALQRDAMLHPARGLRRGDGRRTADRRDSPIHTPITHVSARFPARGF